MGAGAGARNASPITIPVSSPIPYPHLISHLDKAGGQGQGIPTGGKELACSLYSPNQFISF